MEHDFFIEYDEKAGFELLPCPFCGSSAMLMHTTDNQRSLFVSCTGAIGQNPCYAEIRPWRYKTVKEAVDAWNRRVN